MEIKHENIDIVVSEHLTICQKEVKNELELGRRFIEYALTPLESAFGNPIEIKIRKDIEDNVSSDHIKGLGGFKAIPVFMRIINAITINDRGEEFKITLFLSVQKPEPPKIKYKFLKSLIKFIFGVMRNEM